jgi:hypothetical protein
MKKTVLVTRTISHTQPILVEIPDDQLANKMPAEISSMMIKAGRAVAESLNFTEEDKDDTQYHAWGVGDFQGDESRCVNVVAGQTEGDYKVIPVKTVKIMGKEFEIAKVATSVDEANEYCEAHPDCGVFDENEVTGEITICKVESIKKNNPK